MPFCFGQPELRKSLSIHSKSTKLSVWEAGEDKEMGSRAQPKGHIKQKGPKTGLQSKESTVGMAGKQGSHAQTPRPLTAWRD